MNADLAELESHVRRGDWFALLGLPVGYDLDLRRLKERYLALSRAAHPDFFAADPDQLPRAELVSAGLNRAMTTLEDPVRRAEYLLVRHGGPSQSQDKRVSPEVLQRAMMLQEAIAEAAGDAARLAALRRDLLADRTRLLEQIRQGALQLPATPGQPASAEILSALRAALNEMSYLSKLLTAVDG